MQQRRYRRHGFSLVELVVSILIISLALVASMQLYYSSVLMRQKADNLTLANQTAQRALEYVLSMQSTANYAIITNGPSTYHGASITPTLNPNHVATGGANLAFITITATAGNKTEFQTVTLSTYVTPGGS
jgi:prepilin-type N-terminal cleavage/methylation domain-containing protein